MNRKKVIIWEHIDESGIQLLDNSNGVETIYYDDKPITDDELFGSLEQADAVMVRIKDFTGEMIQRAPNLEIIAKHGVGYDQIDVAAATKRNIPVTITPEANSDSVADHAMALMLSLSRNLLRATTDVRTGQFLAHCPHISQNSLTPNLMGLSGTSGRSVNTLLIRTRAPNFFVINRPLRPNSPRPASIAIGILKAVSLPLGMALYPKVRIK